MRKEIETFQTTPSDSIRQEMDKNAAEVAQMRDSVELTRSDMRRTKNDITRYQEEHDAHVRRTRALWVIVVLVVGGLAGLSWYGFPILSEHKDLLGKMPVLQSTLDSVGTKVLSAQNQIGTWADDKIQFSERMAGIEKTVGSNLATVRNEARLVAQQLRSDLGNTVQAIQNRVSGVESIQREHSDVVARLQNELQGVRQELAGLREENERQILQVEQAQQTTRNDVSGLDRRLILNQGVVSALGNQVDRQRIDFDLQSGRTEQIADGIYVTVKKTDTSRQQIEGWVQIARDGRIVWLRGEGAQTPIEFSVREDPRPYRLVFTGVGTNNATGYVLVPIASTASAASN